MSLQQVAATKSLCVYRSRDKLLQQFARCREFLWKSLSQQQSFVVQIQSDLIFCDLLWRQNSVSETETFTKKFSRTHKKTCSCDSSPQRVAATCRLVCSALKTFAAFHSSEHTQWNEVEAWADSFIQISEFCQPPKPHTFVHRNEGWVY